MSDLHFEPEDERQIPRERSNGIEILCAIGFLAALFWIPQGFTDAWRQGLSWYSLADVLFPVASTVCLVGLWKMRRWAVYTFTGVWIANQIFLLLTGHWSAITVPLSALLIITGFRNLWRMT